MHKSNKILLKNNLRVISVPMADALTTTILILVEAGSEYETRKNNGVSHFLEHMCFKGTEKRLSSLDITSELDAVGAAYNAFTSNQYTGYYAKVQPKYFDEILDIISDIYLNPVFNQREIEKERGVIIEEINMYEDLPMRRVQEFFTNLLYGDQPAGWDIAGKKEIIRRINRNDFIEYQKNHYLGKSTTVVVTGNFNEKEAVKKIESAFSGIRTGKKIQKLKTVESQKSPRIFLKMKETDQAHLVVGVRAFDIFDKRKYAINLLADILGGGMSSRLFQKLREEMGAAYYVKSEADLLSDHGFLTASAGVDNNKVSEAIKAVVEEFERLVKEPIEKEELQRVKDRCVGGLIMGLETSDQLAGFYGGQEIITKKIVSPEETIKKIQAVKVEEISAVAKDIFKNNKLNLAIIGPFKEKPRFEQILKFR
ncbi:insulinase family protein [Candidatus Wolfebacteria bacterium]|nr:insulinase family protein [Candidatus Wolfebacteria bacterium]